MYVCVCVYKEKTNYILTQIRKEFYNIDSRKQKNNMQKKKRKPRKK